jgi:Family of unknown function (DUF6535)
MLAILLQQWSRRYTNVTRSPRLPLHEQARMHAFFSYGVEKSSLKFIAEALPTLIHISLFLFLSGLLIHLFNVNLAVFCAVAWWIAVSAVVYIIITVIPTLRLDTPYYSSLSFPICRACASILYAVLRILQLFKFRSDRLSELRNYYREWTLKGTATMLTETLLKMSLESQLDGYILEWVFDRSLEDRDLTQFLECILGFLNSKVADDPRNIVHRLGGLGEALRRCLHQTWTSSMITESDKLRRLIICMKVVNVARLHDTAWSILGDIFRLDKSDVFKSIEAGHSLALAGLGDARDQGSDFCAQFTVAGFIANVQKRDNRWVTLAEKHLGDNLPRSFEDNHDNVIFVNLIHTTRQILLLNFDVSQAHLKIIPPILQSLSKFDMQNTHPELQHNFCALWNDAIQKAQKSGPHTLPVYVLIGLRRIYINLHQGSSAAPESFTASTNDREKVLYSPSSYPLCGLSSHCSSVHERVSVNAEETRGLGVTPAIPLTEQNLPHSSPYLTHSLLSGAPPIAMPSHPAHLGHNNLPVAPQQIADGFRDNL